MSRFRGSFQEALTKAHDSLKAALDDRRELEPDERAHVDACLEAIERKREDSAISAEIDAMKYGGGSGTAGAADVKSGAVTFDSDAFAAFKASVADGSPAALKATVTTGTGGVPPEYRPGRAVTVAREAVRLRSIFPMENVTAPSVFFRRLTTGSTAAATVAEGDLKPEATVVAAQVEAPVRKIAVFLPVTDEAIADGGQQFVAEMVDDLTRDLIRAENAQIVNGNGTAPNLRGILQTTGIQTRARGTDSNLDAVLKATTMLRTVAFLEPTHVVMHPTNFEAVRLSKATGGEYLLGDPLAAGQPTLMGARVMLTTDAPLGTALVLNAPETARVYLRSDIRVDFGTTGDFFQRNIQAIRAETRLAFAVRRPSAVVSVTGLT